MINLMRKDYLIVKKIWLGMMVIAAVLPPFLSFFGDGVVIPAALTLSMMSILLSMILFAAIYEEEEKYPKAAALITTIGYSRTIQVVERYILMLAAFLYCTIVYAIESHVIEGLGALGLFDFLTAMFCYVLVESLYLGLTTRFGLRAGRYILMAVIFGTSLGPSMIAKLNITLNFSGLRTMNEYLIIFLLVAMTVVAYLISLMAALKAYEHKEL
ncbi:MAG: ABC-2 transporter permease [Peptoniphilus sp.]|nr:ABC-2 transporter permease [Peptoniphilus sp.]MDD7362656.1 ABC-2 transporter permease [Bacillota bacterium]MDY6044945.1 ABC-2 transporter permease [Peptoniphilus sp.]